MGYGLYGCGGEVIDFYGVMRYVGIWLNDVIFFGFFIVCKNLGFVKEGWDFFYNMKDYGIEFFY